MKRFKHSGTYGDLIYSLPLVKHFGGGEFYLHLNQIDWVAQHYYRSRPPEIHQGRMTLQDFQCLEPLLMAQDYITKFEPLDPRTTEITHNLDSFRELFVSHPGNYVDVYAEAWGIRDPNTRAQLRNTPWLRVEQPRDLGSIEYVINRTGRWQAQPQPWAWAEWRDQGIDRQSLFVGTEQEYRDFCRDTGWQLEFCPTKNLLELAEIIAGCQQFIGNQSLALSLAIGLGQSYACEARTDLPLERNECWFPDQGDYFQ